MLFAYLYCSVRSLLFPVRAVDKGLRLLDAIVGKERILGKVTIY